MKPIDDRKLYRCFEPIIGEVSTRFYHNDALYNFPDVILAEDIIKEGYRVDNVQRLRCQN